MEFSWVRTIHFGDTDAAGVVFFANYLRICHEAYEEALAAAGMELGRYFAATGTIVPISKSEMSYLRPLQTGDKVSVSVKPHRLSADTFELHFEMMRQGAAKKRAATARTEHVCLNSQTRERQPLPASLAAWVDGI
ncbi:MAG TPA: thioesterase family protein [Opitutaceae bacterium]|jgi:1,4-dihydroxy-2-naphthoyl-CoA hydrolase